MHVAKPSKIEHHVQEFCTSFKIYDDVLLHHQPISSHIVYTVFPLSVKNHAALLNNVSSH